MYDVDLGIFDCVRDCDAVIDTEATGLLVQVLLKALDLGADLLASLLFL